LFFRTVLSANTLVRWVNENAFASVMQARPCPTFGRPVHLRDGSLDYGPVLLLMPFGSHLTVDTLPSGDSEPSPASEAVNPAFGYDAPHPSTRGTSTLLNNALLSAHRDPIRHPDVYLHLSHSRLWLRSPRGDFFPGHRGLLQFPRLHSHPVVADTPPVSASASDSFRSALVAFARYRQSQPPEKRVTRLLLRSFDLQPGALRTLLARVCCRRAPPSCSHATVPPMLRGLSLLTSVGLSPT